MLTFQILFGIFLIILILFFRTFVNFFSMLIFNLRHLTGFIIDKKVNDVLFKAVIIAEIDAQEKEVAAPQKLQLALQNAHSIVSDVLLQHGLNPRDYNIPKLISYARFKLGLTLNMKGGEKNGKG